MPTISMLPANVPTGIFTIAIPTSSSNKLSLIGMWTTSHAPLASQDRSSMW
jgi:hypothetical protein